MPGVPVRVGSNPALAVVKTVSRILIERGGGLTDKDAMSAARGTSWRSGEIGMRQRGHIW